MFKIIALTLVAVSTVGTVRFDQNGRIVGGTDAMISSYPWQVSVQISGSHICGGAIYDETTIITAAHCVATAAVTLIKVRAGSTYYNRGGSLIQVAAKEVHEGYNDVSLANNIAIVRLTTPLTYGLSIKPIGLATTSPVNGAAAVVTGWGLRENDGNAELSTTLQYADVWIIGRTQCASTQYSYGSLIDASMICAAATDKDACRYDAGGSLVSGRQLVGIVSWGFGCANSIYPGVYADIAVLRSWLLNAVNKI